MRTDRSRKWGLPRLACKFVSVVTLFFFSAGTVFALPSGQQVVSGQATFAAQGNNLTITNSPNAIIHWQGFSINSNEAVRFIQQYGSSAVLNRVLGQDPSRILGLLQSNGRVFLINPNGILIGQGARIDVNGLVASTLNISNQDFMAGKYNFTTGEIAGPIQNQGTITTPAGGKVYLIAPDVENSGLIESPGGEVILAAGRSVQLVDSLDPNLSVVVSAPEDKAVNLGQIMAESGKVGIYGGLISQKGIVRADSAVVGENGRIFFKASKDVTLDAGSVTSAKGGGKIEVFGDMKSGSVTVNGALDVSAPDGGNGGFIETSAAHVKVGDSASVTALAPHGKTGAWLIDPTNYTIGGELGDISGAALGTQLNSANVTIATVATGAEAGDIFVDEAVAWNSANTLTLNAHNDINVNAPITSTNPMGAQLILRADLDANGAGTVAFGGAVGGPTAGSVNMGAGYGTVSIFYNPTDYAAYGADTGNFNARITSGIRTYHMLVNNVNDLQRMETNLAGTYALGKDIDAAATSGWDGGQGFAPITTFSGLFEGLGHTITGLHINRPTTDSVGLFGFPTSSLIRNVGLVNVNITGQSSVGGLVGYNMNGSITNASSSGTVSGKDAVGGLAGVNYGGYISGSYSSGTVSGTGNGSGGLVGMNQEYANIYGSYSTAAVTGAGDYTGGLAGMNSYFGNIGNSHSTGAVSGVAQVGGLVGYNFFSGNITNAYSTGSVTGTGGSIGGLAGNNQFGSGADPRFASGKITNSYSSGTVSGSGGDIGGLVGIGGGTVTDSYWDVNTSGQTISAGGTGKTTAEMMTQTTFAPLVGGGWNFSNTWWMSDTNTRPFLRSEYSAKITNAHQFQMILSNLAGTYTLVNDIDMAEITRASGMWNTTKGFVPLGNDNLASPAGNIFTGAFDGLGHTITGIFINRPSTPYVGTFGGTSGGAGNIIQNVGLVNLNITGGFQTGGLVAHTGASILNCYTTGQVTSGNNNVGGLVGLSAGSISNSYSTAAVTGGTWVGGLVGTLYTGGSIVNSYSTGAVSGSSMVGGLVGYNFGAGPITNSYWDTQTSGRATSDGGTGKTTAEMKTQSSYAGWDFTNTWEIVGSSYPSLRFQTAAAPPPAPQQTISGALDAGVGKTIYFAVNGTLRPESATTAGGGLFSVSLPDNTVPAGGALLVYVFGDPVKGAYVFLSSGGNISNLFIESNTLIAGSAGGTISNATLGAAKGGLGSADIPYGVFGTDLTLNANISFKTASGTPYSVSGNITTTGGSQAYNGPVTLLGNTVLAAGTGNITFGSAVTGPGYNLTLNSQGIVSQGAPIAVSGLELLDAGGTYNLTQANVVATLAGYTGTVQFTNSTGINIGTVNATTGLKTSGNLVLNNTGAVNTEIIESSGGAVNITAHSPLTIGPGGVSAFDSITLKAAPSGGSDNLTINGNITSTNGFIDLLAGSSIVVAPGALLSAPLGVFQYPGLNGAPAALADLGRGTATNSTVSSLMTAMGRITSDENGDDENELKKKSSGSGQQSTEERKTDESKNYCN